MLRPSVSVLFSLLAAAGCCLTTESGESSSTTTSVGGGVGTGISVGSSGTGASSGGVGTGSSGASTGGCVPGIASTELSPCSAATPCGCPYECVHDPFASIVDQTNSDVCEAPCSTEADCDLLRTGCVGNFCMLVACGGASGNGAPNSTCSMGGAPNDGTCILAYGGDGGTVEECFAAGSADGGCNFAAAHRSQLSVVCLPGFDCVGGQQGGTVCTKECDDITSFCPKGQTCELALGVSPATGFCF